MMSYLPRLFYFGELLQVQFLWGCAKLVVANVNILEGTMCPLQSLTLQQRKYILLLWLPNLFFLMANAYHFSDSHNMGPEHVPRHGPRTRPTTWAPNTSHNMGPEHVPQHGPRTRPTTWAPNTSRNMGPGHVT